MFNNIGDGIKGLAKIIFWVGSVLCVIAGIGMLNIIGGWGIALLLGGPFLLLVISCVLYGFGQLVENSDILVKQGKKRVPQKKTPPAQNYTTVKLEPSTPSYESETDSTASKPNSQYLWKCEHCGKMISLTPCPYCGK